MSKMRRYLDTLVILSAILAGMFILLALMGFNPPDWVIGGFVVVSAWIGMEVFYHVFRLAYRRYQIDKQQWR
jgi:hypothetical protein